MNPKFKEIMPQSGEEIIRQYFKCVEEKDVEGALELFDSDAIIYEPFSNISEGLRGRSSIEPFLRVAMMANSNFRRSIDLQRRSANGNTIEALVTFEKGDKTLGKFTFEFTSEEPNPRGQLKIKVLHIKF